MSRWTLEQFAREESLFRLEFRLTSLDDETIRRWKKNMNDYSDYEIGDLMSKKESEELEALFCMGVRNKVIWKYYYARARPRVTPLGLYHEDYYTPEKIKKILRYYRNMIGRSSQMNVGNIRMLLDRLVRREKVVGTIQTTFESLLATIEYVKNRQTKPEPPKYWDLLPDGTRYMDNPPPLMLDEEIAVLMDKYGKNVFADLIAYRNYGRIAWEETIREEEEKEPNICYERDPELVDMLWGNATEEEIWSEAFSSGMKEEDYDGYDVISEFKRIDGSVLETMQNIQPGSTVDSVPLKEIVIVKGDSFRNVDPIMINYCDTSDAASDVSMMRDIIDPSVTLDDCIDCLPPSVKVRINDLRKLFSVVYRREFGGYQFEYLYNNWYKGRPLIWNYKIRTRSEGLGFAEIYLGIDAFYSFSKEGIGEFSVIERSTPEYLKWRVNVRCMYDELRARGRVNTSSKFLSYRDYSYEHNNAGTIIKLVNSVAEMGKDYQALVYCKVIGRYDGDGKKFIKLNYLVKKGDDYPIVNGNILNRVNYSTTPGGNLFFLLLAEFTPNMVEFCKMFKAQGARNGIRFSSIPGDARLMFEFTIG